MTCDLSKLYWMFKCSLTTSKCSGEAIKLGNLNPNFDRVLLNNKCLGSTPEVTMARLMLNRLTPCTGLCEQLEHLPRAFGKVHN